MQGVFDVSLLNAGGLNDAAFQRAIREGTVDRLLSKLKVEKECRGVHNRIFDNNAGIYLDALFSLGACATYYNNLIGGALSFIMLANWTSEPTSYTETWTGVNSYTYEHIHDAAGTVNTGSASKRFDEDQLSPWEVWSDTDREVVHFRNRWLWSTSQGNASNISSVGIFHHSDPDGTGSYGTAKSRIGRVRLKDGAGNPVTLNKTSNHVLLMQYTFSLMTM